MNIKKLLILGFATSIVLTGCGDSSVNEYESSSESSLHASEVVDAEEKSATIIVNANDEFSETEITFVEGQTLTEAMIDSIDSAEIDEEGFVSSINGHSQSADNNTWWVFTVNNEMITVGANEYTLMDGDIVEWELLAF